MVESPSISFVRTDAGITLSWPANAAGFGLESSSDLGSGTAWSAVSATPVVQGDVATVVIEITGDAGYFRLIRR